MRLLRSLRGWVRGDGLVAAREAASRAAGIDDPAAALHALDLVQVARAVYEGRHAAPIGRGPALACQLATTALAQVAARFPDPLATEAQGTSSGDARVAEIVSAAARVWTMADRDAARLTRAAFVEIDRRLKPSRRVLRRLSGAGTAARWRGVTVLSAALVAVIALSAVIVVLTRPRNLLEKRAYRLSSASKDFDAVNQAWRGQHQAVFFMTNEEQSPWIEYDLGRPTRVRRVLAENRPDCCHERPVPLVIEASDDQAQWRELARITREFGSWNAEFPATTTRYLRLRTDKKSMLHLAAVEAYDR